MKIRPAWLAASAVLGLAALSAAGWTIASDAVARHIADKLNRNTGFVWGIAGVGIGAGPSLVLDGVTAEANGGSALSARVVRLSGSWTLLTGRSGTLRARAEGVDVRLALEVPPSARIGGEAAGIAAIDGIATVARWDVAENGRSLSVAVPTAEIDLELDPAAAGTAHRFDVAVPGHRLRIAMDQPTAAAEAALRLTLDPSGPDGHRVGVQGMLRREGGGLRVDRIAGTVDGGSLTGDVRFDHSGEKETGKPRFAADLRLDALTLAPEGVEPGPSAGLTVPLPSAIVPDPRWFAAFEGECRLAIGRLAIGQVRSEGVVIAATVRGGVLDATLTAAQAYDGAVKARYGLAPAGGTGRHRLALTLTHGQLRPLMVDLLGIAALDGRATASLELQATGAHHDDLLRSATGSADVSLTDGRIDGSGLTALVSGPDGRGSATRFSYLGGRLRIADGEASTDDLALRSPLIEAAGRGNLDLVGQTLDLTFHPTVTQQRGRRPNPGRAFSVPVRVSGPWDNPSVSADMSALLRDPGATIEALQDLGTGLFGNGGDGLGGSGLGGSSLGGNSLGGNSLGGALDALLAKPRQDAPAPRRR